MLYLEGNRIQPMLIDLASSVRLGEISAQDRQKAIKDDFSDLIGTSFWLRFILAPSETLMRKKPYGR